MTDPVIPLGVALKREMARVRDEVLPQYEEAGLPGAASLMCHDLDWAATVLAEGDVVAMLHAYEALKGWEP